MNNELVTSIRPLTLLSILRLYKRMKPLSFVLVLHRAFFAHNLNGENEASLAEAIFNNAEVYKNLSYFNMADHLMNYLVQGGCDIECSLLKLGFRGCRSIHRPMEKNP